ncbi:response regulator [Elusimicrobiota bacterium]
MDNKIYTTFEIAKQLNVDISSVSNWIDSGKLKAYRTPGGHRRVKKKELIKFTSDYNMPLTADKSDELNVLIVDDEERVRNTIKRKVAGSYPQITVYEAGDGFTAGKVLASERIDLLILDIQMPGMNGYEVMAQIKSDEKLGNPGIIIITGFPENGIKEKIITMGAKELLIKPFDINELAEAIEKTINN